MYNRMLEKFDITVGKSGKGDVWDVVRQRLCSIYGQLQLKSALKRKYATSLGVQLEVGKLKF